MITRHGITNDSELWERLEYSASAWLTSSDDKRLRRFWIDGFTAETAKNTQRGADIEGTAWIGEGSRQHEYRFVASLPQKVLHGRHAFVIDDITIDDAKKQLTLIL